MSAMSPGCSGFQPSSDRVLSLEAGQSIAANLANQPKCSAAFSADCEATGTFSLKSAVEALAFFDLHG